MARTIGFAHYHLDVIDIDRMRIDPAKLDAVARLGGNTCSNIRDRSEMPTPTLAEFKAGRSGDARKNDRLRSARNGTCRPSLTETVNDA